MDLNTATNEDILRQLGLASEADFFVAVDEMMTKGEEDKQFAKLFYPDAQQTQALMKYTKQMHGVSNIERYAVKHFALLIRSYQQYEQHKYDGWESFFSEGREDLCKFCDHCHILNDTAQIFCDLTEYNETSNCIYGFSEKDKAQKYNSYLRVFKNTDSSVTREYPRLILNIFRSLAGLPEPNTIEEMDKESAAIDKYFKIQKTVTMYCVESGWDEARIKKLWQAGSFIIKNGLEPLSNSKELSEEDIIFALEIVLKSAQGLLRYSDIIGSSDDFGIMGTNGPTADLQ